MDYSAHDPDHPGDSDPWASSSPRAHRQSFGQPPTSDMAPSPLPPPASPYHEGAGQFGYLGDAEGQSQPQPGQPQQPQSQPQQQPQSQLQSQLQSHPPPSQAQPHPQRYHRTPSQQQQQQHSQHHPQQQHYKLQAKVTGLERNGKKDPILRFDVYTNLPKFRTTQFRDVRRLHSEFVKLGEHLISACPEAIVPAVPPATTSAGAGTDEDETRLKAALQRWLNIVCSSDMLMRDEEMVFFVESDFGYSPVVRRKQPATGVRRKVIKQFAPPPDDTPELAAARPIVKTFYLGTMEAEQKLEKVVKHRRNLGVAESDLGAKFAALHAQESHVGLAHAYKKLAKVIQATGDFHAAQGTAEATTLGDPLQYHSSDAFIAKETLTNRHILLRELLQAQAAKQSKLTAADRLKASSSVKRDKVDEAITALDEARSHEQNLTTKVQRVTANLLQEQRKWFTRTTHDMRQAIREYAIRQIEAERRTLATLESVRPDIRAIDNSGGLSRLGREAHPPTRRAPMTSSQGPKGDAWSGVPRRPGDGLNRSMSGSLAEPLPETDEGDEESVGGRKRTTSKASLKAEEDDDRIDAKNAASRLATTTF